jgi:hypothetical protein
METKKSTKQFLAEKMEVHGNIPGIRALNRDDVTDEFINFLILKVFVRGLSSSITKYTHSKKCFVMAQYPDGMWEPPRIEIKISRENMASDFNIPYFIACTKKAVLESDIWKPNVIIEQFKLYLESDIQETMLSVCNKDTRQLWDESKKLFDDAIKEAVDIYIHPTPKSNTKPKRSLKEILSDMEALMQELRMHEQPDTEVTVLPKSEIRDILISRDQLYEEEAEELILQSMVDFRSKLSDGENMDDFCQDWFGLEPDYLEELIERASN